MFYRDHVFAQIKNVVSHHKNTEIMNMCYYCHIATKNPVTWELRPLRFFEDFNERLISLLVVTYL